MLVGHGGANTIIGGKGNDTLKGLAGGDTYRYNLGDGNDTLTEDSDDDVTDQLIFSGTGLTSTNVIAKRVAGTNDLFLSFNGIIGSVLVTGQFENYWDPYFGIESITFSDGVVWDENKIWNAYLTLAEDTNDVLVGHGGANTIIGGKGNDTLTGGGGVDSFIFATITDFTTANLGIDRITDFTLNSDKIVLGKITFAVLTSPADSALSASEFATINETTNGATIAGASTASIVFNRANGSLFYNPDGATAGLTGGGQFATLTGVTGLSASDFLLRA
ncbi:MAG: calcium-binding protein [Synechococcales bacterium]|nr:calcium-binding protein [Synechococcales bacterium]